LPHVLVVHKPKHFADLYVLHTTREAVNNLYVNSDTKVRRKITYPLYRFRIVVLLNTASKMQARGVDVSVYR